MRQAIGNIHGALRNKELTSKPLVALEQVEDDARQDIARLTGQGA